jgi:hypothetical protein
VCALALEGVGLTNPAAAEGYAGRGAIFRPFEPAVYFKSILMFRPNIQKARPVKVFSGELMASRGSKQGF